LASYGTPPGDQAVWVENNVDPIGCQTDSDTIYYFVHDAEPINLLFDGTTLRSSYDCLSHLWYKDGVLLNNEQDSALVVLQNGCYWCGCITCEYIMTDTICITNLGVNDFAEISIEVFPNPFSETVSIQFSEEQDATLIELLDPTGKLVRKVVTDGKEQLLKREGLAAGAYFIHIYNGNSDLNETRFVLIE
jgi:hypothetical protein